MNASWFVLGILFLLFLAGAWRRLLEYRLKVIFMRDQIEWLQKHPDLAKELTSFKKEDSDGE